MSGPEAMTSQEQELLTRVARAICASDFDGDNSVYDTMSEAMREHFIVNARAAIEACANALECASSPATHPHRGGKALSDCTCIVCRRSLDNIMDGRGFQPDNGLAFLTYGHYGSTFFDPMDGSYLEIAVCDDCIRTARDAGRVHSGKST